MKKMKKVIAMSLVAALAVSALTGCGKKSSTVNSTGPSENAAAVKKEGYPVVDEKVSIKAVGWGDPNGGEWEDYPIFKELEEKTNVDVTWQTIMGEGSEEKLNLIMASKDLPDAVFSGLSSSKILNYASKGLIRPLEDLIDGYAPNLKKILDENPDIRKAITMPDGHIYALPSVNRDQEPAKSTVIIANKDWLDKLGLEAPTTTEEFEKVLAAFKGQDLNGNGENDEIPFTYEPVPPYNIWNGDAGFSGAFGVTDSDSYLMMKDSKLVLTPAEEGYKEYIKWTADLYEKGLIDREIFTQDHNQYMAKISAGRVGFYLTNGPVITDKAKYEAIPPLKGPNGDQTWAAIDFTIDKNRGVITTTNKNPEATMRLMDTFYEPMNSLNLRYGIYLQEEGDKFRVLTTVPGKSAQAPGPYVATCETKAVGDQYLIKTEDDIRNEKIQDMYRPFLAEAVPLLNFTPEESKEISTLQTDLKKVIDESKAKWTTKQSDIDADWDGYIKSLNNMGLERYLELYNGALARYQEN